MEPAPPMSPEQPALSTPPGRGGFNDSAEPKPHRVLPCLHEEAEASMDTPTETVIEALVETDVVAGDAPMEWETKMKCIRPKELAPIVEMILDANDAWLSAVEELETVCLMTPKHLTLLHLFAGDKSKRGLTEYLLKAGIPPNIMNESRETPLFIAAMKGDLFDCQLLIDYGANIKGGAAGKKGKSPVGGALHFGHHDVAMWLLHHPNYGRKWSRDLFQTICEQDPDLVVPYLKRFAVDLTFDAPKVKELPNRINASRKTRQGVNSTVYYLSVNKIYGHPDFPVACTALATVIKTPVACDALACKAMRYTIKAKWQAFGRRMFRREVFLYSTLLAAFSLSVICEQATTSNGIHGSRQNSIFVERIVAALLAALLLVTTERRELRVEGPVYFLSFWNLLGAGTYVGIILITVFQAFGFQSELLQAAIGVLNATLWINLFQYLQMAGSVAVLITMMSDMVRDVVKFILLYCVFLFGFSGGFYVLLLSRPGYETFVDALITTLLMLFGQITYDPFNAATGLTWVVSNLLLLAYLVSVAIVLLNLLIAMMSTSYSRIWEKAEGQVLLSYAQAIVRMEKSLSRAQRVKMWDTLMNDEKELPKRSSARERIDRYRDRVVTYFINMHGNAGMALFNPEDQSIGRLVMASIQLPLASCVLYAYYGRDPTRDDVDRPLAFTHFTQFSTLEDGERWEFGHKQPTTDEQATLSTRVDTLSTQVDELKSLVERQTTLIESLSSFVKDYHAAGREATESDLPTTNKGD